MNNHISIAIATYNGERFLREQLDSLYQQTRVPDEIIVCDDCSTDNTVSILEEYHQKYGLTYYVNPTSLGVNKNFFKAISLCTGDFICICDQDDIWMPNKIETLYDAIKKYDNSQCNCISSQVVDINAKSEIIGVCKKTLPDTEGWQATLLMTGHSQGCTMMFNQVLKNRVLHLYHSNALADSMMYDVFIAFVSAIEGNKKNLGTQLMYYRHHDKNVVGKFSDTKLPFAKKIQTLPTYYPLFLDLRIRNVAIMHEIYQQIELPHDIQLFLNKMYELQNCESIIKGLAIICTLPISTNIKIKTCFYAPIIKTIKNLIR